MSENKRIKTIFCDIDGTLIRQLPFEELDENVAEVLPGVHQKLAQWRKAGHHIVLTTARPYELWTVTVKQMYNAKIEYDQLLMGIGREERILINNNSKSTPAVPRAFAVDVPRDSGFENVDFENVGL